jgi:hypothetical protein
MKQPPKNTLSSPYFAAFIYLNLASALHLQQQTSPNSCLDMIQEDIGKYRERERESQLTQRAQYYY